MFAFCLCVFLKTCTYTRLACVHSHLLNIYMKDSALEVHDSNIYCKYFEIKDSLVKYNLKIIFIYILTLLLLLLLFYNRTFLVDLIYST